MSIDLEWGSAAIEYQPTPDLYLIIDVLSFSTAVDIALSRGAIVWPYLYKDARAQAYAQQRQALLAGPRSSEKPSLSPASLQKLAPGSRLILPSPNGATLSTLTGKTPTLSVCLRNAEATAAWICRQPFHQILVVPAGERWPDQHLRPALEDLLGAGAVIAALQAQKPRLQLTAEAEAARWQFAHAQPRLSEIIHASRSGQELVERGFPEDIKIATALNTSQQVALLNTDGAYCVA